MNQLRIGEKTTRFQIIQGGMGVGVSLSKLAGAVANAGGIGVISGVQIGFREPDFENNSKLANIRALTKEIRKARSISPKGILGVNLMVAIENYKEMVSTAVSEGIDLIISGAGLPSDLPSLIKGSTTKIAPIVSSGKAAAVITKLWKKRYDYIPDLIIIEGPLAGGHLGFSWEALNKRPVPTLSELIKEVHDYLSKLELSKSIPLIAAGGLYHLEDIKAIIDDGAAGVQLGSRFVATYECDASKAYKQAYIDCKKEDIIYVESPVGMPGQAIRNSFVRSVSLEKQNITKCFNCLQPCNPKTTRYCISHALINAVTGNVDEGLIFIGKNGYKIDKISSVEEVINELFSWSDKRESSYRLL